MIETREALEALDDILGVDGMDGVFIGPADLSIALNNGARWDPRGAPVLEAAARVVARARAHGKYAGMFCYDGADAGAMAALGFKLCSVGSDGAFLRAAARAEIAAARGQARARPWKGRENVLNIRSLKKAAAVPATGEQGCFCRATAGVNR